MILVVFCLYIPLWLYLLGSVNPINFLMGTRKDFFSFSNQMTLNFPMLDLKDTCKTTDFSKRSFLQQRNNFCLTRLIHKCDYNSVVNVISLGTIVGNITC